MAFSDKLVEILNHGAVNLGIGIGYSLKLFDAMDEAQGPVTLEELAGQTELSPRYLAEWMGIMVTAGIVETDPKNPDAYLLPPSHGDLLCRRAGSNNLGVYFQEIPLLTSCAMEAVKADFKACQGIPFDTYPRFQAFMTELADAKHEKVLIPEFLPSVDDGRLVERLSQGITVCDLGCGQGTAVHLMARAFPKSAFWGIDNHGPAIETAREKAFASGLSNAVFMETDTALLAQDDTLKSRFDWVCAFDAIHDQSHPLAALKGVRHILKPSGLFSMIDIKAESGIRENLAHPMAPFLYTVSLMHCLPVGLNDNGRGLGMMWGKQKALALLSQAGFRNVRAEEIPNDAFNLHFACRP